MNSRVEKYTHILIHKRVYSKCALTSYPYPNAFISIYVEYDFGVTKGITLYEKEKNIQIKCIYEVSVSLK